MKNNYFESKMELNKLEILKLEKSNLQNFVKKNPFGNISYLHWKYAQFKNYPILSRKQIDQSRQKFHAPTLLVNS